VHFAVSTEKVAMCTRLQKHKSKFLPFNKNITNPPNPDGFSTEYLWKEVWSKKSILDLVQNFVNFQQVSEKYFDERTRKIAEKKKEILIFPRFHQFRAVNRILVALKKDGVSSSYLVQHSAGSGKTNTITWLALKLAGFFRNPDDNKRMFDTIIVVTDRRILDKQLQNNIKQFEQVPGVVECIDDKKSSQDLRKAIEKGKSIIVTTLQKFPVISETVARSHDKTYAVIIDEAHSSQSGESARHLRKSLSLEEAEYEDKPGKSLDDIVLEEIEKKGRQRNISYFAFTATPKNKTLELFGTMIDSQLRPFDEYSMEQAIKEGFILDVLKNYVSFSRYYRLAKRPEIEDSEYETKKTVRLLNSYVDLQDHAIEMKARIMIEHFVAQTQKEIQGKARAMLVTRSRLHAVRYKRKFDSIMRDMKLPYGALVAFSGTVYDTETDENYTENSMNNLAGRISITDALKTPAFRILIVANKFQTGFDEPLLQTMFVDKKLGGVSTVQTISRLNRTAPGKDATMVLDFVNDPEKIREDFQKYYGSSYMEEEHRTDPNSLYDLQLIIDRIGIISLKELDAYASIYYDKDDNMELLQPILKTIVNRFMELEDEQKSEFRSAAKDFVRLYRFLSQIITFRDVELEKYYIFLVGLVKHLPRKSGELPLEVLEQVDLESYKIQKSYEGQLNLAREDQEMFGITPGNVSEPEPGEYDLLSNIIKTLNETYGLNLSEEDRLDFEQIRQKINTNESLMAFFNKENSKDNIRDKFNDELDSLLLDFVNTKLELYNKLSEDKVNAALKRIWFNELYDKKVRGMV
jgi:type I restriction enzyme R subunit